MVPRAPPPRSPLPVPMLAEAWVTTGEIYAYMMRRDTGLTPFDPDSSDDYVPLHT